MFVVQYPFLPVYKAAEKLTEVRIMVRIKKSNGSWKNPSREVFSSQMIAQNLLSSPKVFIPFYKGKSNITRFVDLILFFTPSKQAIMSVTPLSCEPPHVGPHHVNALPFN